MARGRPIPAVNLEKEIKKQHQSMAQSRSLPHGHVRRANIVLMAAEGLNNKTIANRIGLSASVSFPRKQYLVEDSAESKIS